MASSPLHSQVPRRGRKCYVTPAFSGASNARRKEKFRSGYLTPSFSGVPNAKRREKLSSGYVTPAFSGAHKRAEVIRDPCILGGPQRQARVDIQKWLLVPYLLGGLEEGGSAV